MLSLTSELDTQCSALFVQCDEFNSTQALRAVFVTTDLAPFADGLPESTGSKKTFVSLVKLYLLEKHLVDGRVLILPFLNTLRGRYPEQAALHGELDDLYRRILAHAQPAPLPPPLSLIHHFICYAPRDGAQHAQRLHAALQQAGALPWLDQLDTPAGHDSEAARQEALRECANLLLILTPASARIWSESAREWRRALGYKKPIIPLRFTPGADLPLMLGNRPVLDFTGPLAPAVDNLRQHLADLGSPAGQLHELEYRLADAERELRPDPDNPRILQDIERLEKEITVQRAIARDPEAAARAAKERNQAAMERERQPARPTAGRARTKFINPPPLVAPAYFQNRHVENHLIADFLRDPARRLDRKSVV